MLMRVLRNTARLCDSVYVRSRRRTRELADFIFRSGISAAYYHAGLSHEDKIESRDRWRAGEVRVIVATNAFGMGIDRADVRYGHTLRPAADSGRILSGSGRADDGLPLSLSLWPRVPTRVCFRAGCRMPFPPKDFILKVYDTACVFLDVAVGGGWKETFEMNVGLILRPFRPAAGACSQRPRHPISSGYIEYVDEVASRSRVFMTVRRDELYAMRLDPGDEEVLNGLMRNCGGTFADYVNYRRIAPCAPHRPHAERGLSGLAVALRQHVLIYIPRAALPTSIFGFTHGIEASCHSARSVYEERREAFAARLGSAMKRYVFDSSSCRVRVMLEYFGEKSTQDCGTCDVCRDRRRTPFDRKAFSVFWTPFFEAAGSSTVAIEQLLQYAPAHRVEAIEYLRELSCSGRIIIDGTPVFIVLELFK